MTPCVRLHLIPGSHAPGCTCTRDCRDHDGHCTGCLPAEATHGLICDTDSRRLRGHLGAEQGLDPTHPVHGLPWAWENLEHAYPSLTQAPGRGGSSVDDPEAERLTGVLDLRRDMHDIVLAWTALLIEATALAGPDLPDPRDQRLATSRRVNWLLAHVEALEAHGAVGDALVELGDLMSRAHDLAPWRPAPTHVDGIPCRCGAFDLHDHSDLVKCWTCGFTMDRDKYRVLTKVYARRFADDPRGKGATETPQLVKVQEAKRVVDLRHQMARIEAALEELKDARLETLEAAARWSELVARHERIRAALEPAVAGHGGRA